MTCDSFTFNMATDGAGGTGLATCTCTAGGGAGWGARKAEESASCVNELLPMGNLDL